MKRLIPFLVALALCAPASPAAAQRACASYAGVEPIFHRYGAMLQPRSEDHARATARRVRLAIGNDDGETYLRRKGLRADHAGFGDLAAAVDSAQALARHWLSGAPLNPRLLRQHSATQGQMGRTLVDSGCFSGGLAAQVGTNDAPNSQSDKEPLPEEPTIADAAATMMRSLRDFRDDPPPWWVLALYALVLGGSATGLAVHIHLRRKYERRGYPRHIFTGDLVLLVDGDPVTVTAADIGRGGAKIRMHHRLEDVRRVTVQAAGLEIPALMSWQNTHFLGISFIKPITRGALRAIRRGDEAGRNENGARGAPSIPVFGRSS